MVSISWLYLTFNGFHMDSYKLMMVSIEYYAAVLIESNRLEPLLARIKEDRTAVLCPEIDNIDKMTLDYGGTGSYSVGGFWWSLHFAWRSIPLHESRRRKSLTDPIR